MRARDTAVPRDTAQCMHRLEQMLANMLKEIPRLTSEAVREELKHAADRPQSRRVVPPNASLQVPLPGATDGVHSEGGTSTKPVFFGYHGPDVEPQDIVQTPRSADPVSQKAEAWGGKDDEAKFKLERDKVKGVRDFLELKKKSEHNTGSRISCRRAARDLVESSKFEWTCATLIILCAMLIGVEANWSMENVGSPEPLAFRVLNAIFNVAFTVELFLRCLVDGCFFFSAYHPSLHWNIMDALLVCAGLVEEMLTLVFYAANINLSGLKIIRTVRLARILRIVKVVRFFSELRIMVNGVIGSAKSLIWALCLLLLVNFLFGVLFMMLSLDYLESVDSTPELLMYFGSLPRTMLTLYESISGGIDWNNAAMTLRPVSVWMEYIFSAYIFFTVFCCLNIVTGIFVDNAKALKIADEEAMHHEAMKERQKWIAEVAELFSKITREHDGQLTKDNFVFHVTNSDRIATCFYHLGINTDTTNTDELWELFDMDENGCIDQDEFAMGIKQFHGEARSIDLFKLRRELKELTKEIREKIFL